MHYGNIPWLIPETRHMRKLYNAWEVRGRYPLYIVLKVQLKMSHILGPILRGYALVTFKDGDMISRILIERVSSVLQCFLVRLS